MTTSFKVVLLTVTALLLTVTLGRGLPRESTHSPNAPEFSQCHIEDPPPPDLFETRDCGVPDNVGPSYPALTDSMAASVGLSFLLLVFGSRRFFTLSSRRAQRASQLLAVWLVVSVVGSAMVALIVASWSPFVSAAVPTRAEVTSVLLIVLVPVWLLVTGGCLVVGRWLTTRRQVASAQPN